jgi:transposase
LATVATRLPTLENRLALLALLALGWHLGEDARCPTQTSAGARKEKPPAQRGDSRQSVDQDNRRRRRAEGIRRGGKKVKGRKRHLLVDTQGLVLKAKVHSTKVQDREGIKILLALAPDYLPRLSHLWMDASYTAQDNGAGWVQKVFGWTAEIVRHPPKLVPDEVMRIWLREWAKEGLQIDREKLQESKEPRAFLPIRWRV